MTLPELANKLDTTDSADIETRIAIAEQMRSLLGVNYDEFDKLYDNLIRNEPNHLAPARYILDKIVFESASRHYRQLGR